MSETIFRRYGITPKRGRYLVSYLRDRSILSAYDAPTRALIVQTSDWNRDKVVATVDAVLEEVR